MKERIQTSHAPQALGPYSQAIRVGNFLFCSGQIPIDPQTSKVVEGGIEVQTERVLKNIGAVLEAAGGGYDKVVKAMVFLQDMSDFKIFNEVYGKYFHPEKNPPARSTVQVAALPLGVKVEIEVIAQLG